MPQYQVKAASIDSGQVGSWSGTLPAAINDGTFGGATADGTLTKATYRITADSFLPVRMGLASTVSTEVIASVQHYVRMNRPTVNSYLGVNLYTQVFSRSDCPVTGYSGAAAAYAWYTGPALTVGPDGQAWAWGSGSAHSIQNLGVAIQDGGDVSGTDMTSVSEVWALVNTNTIPVPSAVTVTNTVDTLTPTVAWTYTQAESIPQSSAVVKIFDSATYGGAGFNADTSTAISTVTLSGSGVTTAVGTLAVGVTYKAYVKVAINLTGPGTVWSAWVASASTFSITLNDPAPAPAVTVTVQNTPQNILIAATGQINELSANEASIETDATGWPTLTNCTAAKSAVHFAKGANALLVTASAGGNVVLSTGMALHPCSSARPISASVQLGFATSARNAQLDIMWFKDAVGTVASVSGQAGAASALSTSAFTTFSNLNATPPADANFYSLRVTGTAFLISEVMYLDAAFACPGLTAPYSMGGLTSPTFIVQRSADAGTTWTTIGTVATTLGSQSLSYTDYAAPRGVALQYRVAIQGTNSNGTVTSANGTGSGTITNDLRWWFKPVTAPAKNMGGVRVQIPLVDGINEPSKDFWPLSAVYPVVQYGPLQAGSGHYELLAAGPTEMAALITILKHQGSVLIQNPDGTQFYARIMKRNPSRAGQMGKDIYRVGIDWVEQAA